MPNPWKALYAATFPKSGFGTFTWMDPADYRIVRSDLDFMAKARKPWKAPARKKFKPSDEMASLGLIEYVDTESGVYYSREGSNGQ